MLRVGLTGGIACGKSRVLARLAAFGLHPLDLDGLSHELLAPGGAAYADVVAAFGSAVLAPDGSIDRKALGSLVFADPALRARLNAIVHPRVRAEEASRAAAFVGEPGAVVVTDAALLVESGLHLRFQRLVVVHCSPEEQLQRLMHRDGLTEAAARARIEAQMPAQEKRRFAHYEIDTSGPVERTDQAAAGLAHELRALAGVWPSPVPLPLERALGSLAYGPSRGPRGLDPLALLLEIVAVRGVEFERLARLLAPAPEGPWYRAALPHEAGPPPARLAAPLALWALRQGGPDEAFLAAAAASLARLTHVEVASVADACFLALALLHAALTGSAGAERERRSAWTDLARRWAGVPPSGKIDVVLSACLAHPGDPEAARRACAAAHGDADLAGALAGMAAGRPLVAGPADLVAAVHAVDSLAAGS